MIEPKHKFNSGMGATLCHRCSVIITVGFTDDLYCDNCKNVKEQQKKLLVELMELDQKNGLYKNQTAVELLHQQSNELITQYIDGKIDKRELLTMHHNLLYPHKQMEKEQIIKAYHDDNFPCSHYGAEQYYNETYGKE